MLDRELGSVVEGGVVVGGSSEFSSGIGSGFSTGFGSFADGYLESSIDLNKFIVHNRPATFFMRVDGDSMIGAGIFAGDLLVVDRSLSVEPGCVVVACLGGDFTVRRLLRIRGRTFLYPENEKYKPIDVTKTEGFVAWGVVTFVIHRV